MNPDARDTFGFTIPWGLIFIDAIPSVPSQLRWDSRSNKNISKDPMRSLTIGSDWIMDSISYLVARSSGITDPTLRSAPMSVATSTSENKVNPGHYRESQQNTNCKGWSVDTRTGRV